MNDRSTQDCSRLERENWQLKGALGYPVPADIEPGDFRCGLCDAKELRRDEARRECDNWRRWYYDGKTQYEAAVTAAHEREEKLLAALESIAAQALDYPDGDLDDLDWANEAKHDLVKVILTLGHKARVALQEAASNATR